MLRILSIALAGVFISQTAQCQVAVSAGGQDIWVGSDGSVSVKSNGRESDVGAGTKVSVGVGNKVESSVGRIEPGANIEGVTIINGKLWIDGKEVPPGVERYKSPKSGKIYNIERRGTNVSVTSND